MELVQELENVMNNQSGYKFTTDTISFSMELKGDKQAFVTGYISVPEVDLYNDLVTVGALKSLLEQIHNSNITIDFEHEAWRDDNSLLPVAKIVEAKVDERGLWVKAVLNKHSPKYTALWGSIKEGFVNAFSIAFQPLKTVEKTVGDVTVRLIEELKLLNVAFTGAPVSQGSVVTGFGMKAVMLKAIEDTEIGGEQIIVPKRLLNKFMEEKNMVEEKLEEKVEESKEEEPAVEEVKDEEPAKEEEAPAEEAPKAEEPVVEDKSIKIEKESKLIAELKSMLVEQGKEIKKTKAELKDLKENEVFKSPTPDKPELKSSTSKVEMLGLVK